jgi:hypothetical protein
MKTVRRWNTVTVQSCLASTVSRWERESVDRWIRQPLVPPVRALTTARRLRWFVMFLASPSNASREATYATMRRCVAVHASCRSCGGLLRTRLPCGQPKLELFVLLLPLVLSWRRRSADRRHRIGRRRGWTCLPRRCCQLRCRPVGERARGPRSTEPPRYDPVQYLTGPVSLWTNWECG